MRLIDADELIVLELAGIKFVPQDFIDDAPTIDPVKHGRWKHEHIGKYAIVRCSECKSQAPMWETNYCPDCGALMDKEVDDEID